VGRQIAARGGCGRERAATLVELRFFAGLTEREAAEILQVSVASLRRDWAFAKVWLYERLYGARVENRVASAQEV
jgi:DNA-directed RNA polymerase specialized sigma24 family protein